MSEASDFSQTFRHARQVAAGLGVVAALAYLASGLYVVEPEQRGVVIRFGEVVADNVMPGMHYHWPWPIERVERPRTTEVRSLSVPFRTATEGGSEHPIDAGELLTGDENLVEAAVQIQYSIRRPRDYLTRTDDPDGLLKRIVQWGAIKHFAALSVDEALTTGRQRIQGRLKEDIQRLAEDYGIGVRITSVQLQSVEPPAANGVANAFKSVASAREDKQKLMEEASGERNRLVPKARSDAESVLRDAEAYAKEVVERAQGDGERFVAIWREYSKARTITTYRLYLEAIEGIMPRVEKLIINPSANGTGSGAPATLVAGPEGDPGPARRANGHDHWPEALGTGAH